MFMSPHKEGGVGVEGDTKLGIPERILLRKNQQTTKIF